MVGRAAGNAGRRQRVGKGRYIEANDPRTLNKPVALGILPRQRGERRIDFDHGQRQVVDAAGHRKPGGTDAGAEFDKLLA